MPKPRHTLQIFTEKAKVVHNNKYTYLGLYTSSSTKLTIVCPLHGNFQQRPSNHLNGDGCPECNISLRRLTLDQFTKKAHKNPLLSRSEAQRIGAAVMRYSSEYAIDPEVVTAIILVESGARPWVESPKGAIGLMQVMPYMVARRRDVFNQPIAGSLTTVETNIEMGCWILADNIRRRGEEDGISMYFWGNNIQGVGYLDRVSAARRHVRRFVGEA